MSTVATMSSKKLESSSLNFKETNFFTKLFSSVKDVSLFTDYAMPFLPMHRGKILKNNQKRENANPKLY